MLVILLGLGSASFHCPTVNIGSRQDGRLRGKNVIDVSYDKRKIIAAVNQSLFDSDFRDSCSSATNPYWLGSVGPKVADVLAEVSLDQKLIRKRMTLKGSANNGWYQ